MYMVYTFTKHVIDNPELTRIFNDFTGLPSLPQTQLTRLHPTSSIYLARVPRVQSRISAAWRSPPQCSRTKGSRYLCRRHPFSSKHCRPRTSSRPEAAGLSRSLQALDRSFFHGQMPQTVSGWGMWSVVLDRLENLISATARVESGRGLGMSPDPAANSIDLG
jgi:hypothetical protein